MKRDSVQEFFKKFSITNESFYEFIEETTIFVEYEKGKEAWIKIKSDIERGNEIHARSYGDNKSEKKLTEAQVVVKDFYEYIFGKNSIKWIRIIIPGRIKGCQI